MENKSFIENKNTKETKRILLINDMAGYGKVALSVMIPVLSHLKFETFNLPTALVSNTLNYGKFFILDTTQYMVETIKVWESLGFSFDAICTGFIVSQNQADLVYEYCKCQKAKGALMVVDPIMGDDQKLYNGVSEKAPMYMQKLCSISDILIPNITEACLITNCPIKNQYDKVDIQEIFSRFQQLGSKSIVITSVNYQGEMVTVVKDENKDFEKIAYDEIPVSFPGTGDIFTSLVTGGILESKTLAESVQSAMIILRELIAANVENKDKYKGIPVEQYLDIIYPRG